MKNYVVVSVALMLMALPALSMAQTAAPPSSPSGLPATSMAPGGASGAQGQPNGRFEEHKAEVLKRINEHISEATNRKSCVEAATDHEQLKACMPEKGMGEHGGWQHGPGGRGSAMPGGEGGPSGGGAHPAQ
jgi:hypothetical protein